MMSREFKSLKINFGLGGELYMLSLICVIRQCDYFRYYLAYGYSGTYWAGLEIEIDFSKN
jgi:hypothetical protein